MSDYSYKSNDPYVRETRVTVDPPAREAGATMWFIIGGVVVAIVVLFAVFYGAGPTTTVPVGTPADNNVTIENTAPVPAPAPDAATPAPAENAAPADQATPPAEVTPAPQPAPADATPAPAPAN